MASELASARHEVPDTVEAVEFCYQQGWTDGLPVVPPTPERVAEFLAYAGLDTQTVLGQVADRGRAITAEKVAINAVMAGCLPEYFGAVVAAVEALANDRFNAHGSMASTAGAAAMLIVNGPIVGQIGLNSGDNVFGPGWRANATIGRAIRLVLMNVIRAQPGVMDKSTLGHPGKYSYCIAENEVDSPWDPLHVERGLPRDSSAVTVFAAEAPHNINNHAFDPYRLCDAIAGTIATLGANNYYVMGDYTVVLGVDHARILDQAGWKRRHVQRYLFEKARLPVARLRYGGMYVEHLERNLWPRWIERADDASLVPPVREPEDFKIFVAGGAGPHSLVIPGWGTRAITRPIA